MSYLKLTLRYLGGAVVVVLGVLAVSYLQHRFDQSDIKHAVGAVQLARPGGPQDSTLEEKVAIRYGVDAKRISWVPEIESKWQGTVRIKAIVPSEQDDNLVWRVDLIRLNVVPLSAEAKEMSWLKPKNVP